MAKNRPVIGITKPDKEDNFAYACIWLGVMLAGGQPKLISHNTKNAQTALIDGLILGGGKDIFPGRYNHPPKEKYVYDEDRDALEVLWAERAMAENIPALGICRGAQLMNVVTGGTLHADVKSAYRDADYPDGLFHKIFYRKTINIDEQTLLSKILGVDEVKVNSLHKQAIAGLGKNIKVIASEKNGVVQAISHTKENFFLGVQFHPEFLLYRKDMRKIFKALIKSALKRMEKINA